MVKVRISILSHLNDAMLLMDSDPNLAAQHLNVARHLIHMFPNTDQSVDIESIPTPTH